VLTFLKQRLEGDLAKLKRIVKRYKQDIKMLQRDRRALKADLTEALQEVLQVGPEVSLADMISAIDRMADEGKDIPFIRDGINILKKIDRVLQERRAVIEEIEAIIQRAIESSPSFPSADPVQELQLI